MQKDGSLPGLVFELLRHVTPLTRCDVVYFCPGADTPNAVPGAVPADYLPRDGRPRQCRKDGLLEHHVRHQWLGAVHSEGREEKVIITLVQ
jgi:hypothetical protein